jgi:hypothetical protein
VVENITTPGHIFQALLFFWMKNKILRWKYLAGCKDESDERMNQAGDDHEIGSTCLF